ncbi:MAG: dihydrofolate reductase [Bacteroidales bacterium]|nr:dihydrofolate reductase [Bacteroidales bacterium]
MKKLIYLSMIALISCACRNGAQDNFNYKADRFADMEILHYQVPGFENLSLRQKELIYDLSQAALYGRDILYDQNCRYNLLVRHTLEAIYQYADIEKSGSDWEAFEVYLKRVWVSNGIHHHYATDKFTPGFSAEFFARALAATPQEQFDLPKDELLVCLEPVIFDPAVAAKRVNQKEGEDLLLTSANNYYRGVSQAEAEKFYADMADPNDPQPISYGLNSRLVKKDGHLEEEVWKIDGLYGAAIEKIVYWLERAQTVAENPAQAATIAKLVEYYRNGDLRTFDQYNVLWVQDTQSQVDFVNGFIENYGDPIGYKSSWESTVNFKNMEASHRTQVISENAQWFEDHAPIDPRFRKEKVKGITAKVITVAMLGGDCYPTTPIGINLPNADWIRRDYGSKSVTIENITDAYNKAAIGSGYNEEFMWSKKEIDLYNKYGALTDNLHTDLHECLGHASGQLLPGVDPNAMKSYQSAMEEARADLFGLYFLGDEKLVELGILPDKQAYKAEYYEYMMNGALTQLRRIELGNQIEEAHMRNRALVANWVLANGGPKVAELRKRDGKTYMYINDYKALRECFGQLLAEIQRCKSEGDFEAAQQLIETYAVNIDQDLHKEILERYSALDMTAYKGFVNPVLKPVYEGQKLVDVLIDYSEGYVEQHLRYSKEYATLPALQE